MPANHLFFIPNEYKENNSDFRKLLASLNPYPPYFSQLTNNGILYTVHFVSELQEEEFLNVLKDQLPFLLTPHQ